MNKTGTKIIDLSLLIILSVSSARAIAAQMINEEGVPARSPAVSADDASAHFQYGPVSVLYGPNTIERIDSAKNEKPKFIFDLPFVSEVEATTASEQTIMQAFHQTHQTIRDARSLKDIQPAVSANAYQTLQKKVSDGASEIIVLELLRNFIPLNINIVEVQVANRNAKVTMVGKDPKGEFQGFADLSEESGQWKLDNEVWFGGNDPRRSVLYAAADETAPPQLREDPLALVKQNPLDLPFDFEQANPLNLKKSSLHMPKDSFFFFFFIDKNKKTDEVQVKPDVEIPQLHLVWTASKKIVPEQKYFKDVYPLDVSIAPESDGYLPKQFNLRLPRNKPSRFYIGVLYSF